MQSYSRPQPSGRRPPSTKVVAAPRALDDVPSILSATTGRSRLPPFRQHRQPTPSVPATAPVLPPIPRVASRFEHDSPGGKKSEGSYKPLRLTPEARSKTSPPTANPGGIYDRDGGSSAWRLTSEPAPPMSTGGKRPLISTQGSRGVSHDGPFGTKAVTDPRPTTSNGQDSNSTASAESTTHHPKSRRHKLHLLNPMSLLSRRRSGQPGSSASVGHVPTPHALRLPDDYDPRIRGTGVHDFSAPRPKSAVPTREIGMGNVPGTGPLGSQKPLGDDLRVVSWRDANASQRYIGTVSNRQRSKIPSAEEPLQTGPPVPAEPLSPVSPVSSLSSSGSRSWQHSSNDARTTSNISRHTSLDESTEGVRSGAADSQKSADIDGRTPQSTSSSSTPSKASTRFSYQAGPLPKHMRSTNSRFSFDLEGVGSATQEKLLEEKHRKMAENKEPSRLGKQVDHLDSDEESEFGGDHFSDHQYEDDGTYEEDVPEVGVEDDFSEHHHEGDDTSEGNVPGSSVPDVDIDEGVHENLMSVSYHVTESSGSSHEPLGGSRLESVSMHSTENGTVDSKGVFGTEASFASLANSGPTVDPEGKEDAEHTPADLTSKESISIFPAADVTDELEEHGRAGNRSTINFSRPIFSGSVVPDDPYPGDRVGAYNETPTLVVPNVTLGDYAIENFQNTDPSQPDNLMTGEAAPSDDMLGLLGDEDDAEEDDPIIAEANAEALASDADGFYGQEFGFYASGNGFNQEASALGGYFGPMGYNALLKSHSGNATYEEPNLTPITERSEYSTRNSFVWPHLSATQSVQSLHSASLAQLAGTIDPTTPDDALSNLPPFGRSAWAASSISLHTVDDRGSQANAFSPSYPARPHSAGFQLIPGINFPSSMTVDEDALSNDESSSEHASPAGSPTLTPLKVDALGFPGENEQQRYELDDGDDGSVDYGSDYDSDER
ncbi:MAG: hypothetical protein M1823_003786 [Watsoniomyces obsoletus]|nr:MAG: hypothetical protein M1823_003786 [Watsoniomyces obsoletus]